MIKKILFCILIFLPVMAVAKKSTSEQELSQLQKIISLQQQTINNQKKTRSTLLNELEQQEKSIAKVGQVLRQNEKQIKQLDTEVLTLDNEIKTLENQLNEQKVVLSKQLETAFKIGPTSEIELLLDKAQSERNERILQYFAYINKVRHQVINNIQETQKQLTSKKAQLTKKIAAQKKIVEQKKTEQKKMALYRNGRQQILTKLNASLQQNQQKLKELKQNQVALQEKIAKAEREAKAQVKKEAARIAEIKRRQKENDYKPTKDEESLIARSGGLGKPEGRYPWPVKGQILHKFGSPLQGELRWKGVVIGANAGTPVNAISNGRVILASWLQGYGFVVVVEHGKNDMSLYGYNQNVIVKVNEVVKTGQTIALVGDSGGQQRPALYFEIRRNGQALNPLAWLVK